MKKIVLMIIFTLITQITALGTNELYESLDISELESSVPEIAEEIYGDIATDGIDWSDKLDSLWEYISTNSALVFRSAMSSAFAIIAILLLCSMADSIYSSEYIALGGALGISAVAAYDVSAFIGMGEQSLNTLGDFGALLLPCIAAATAATGNVSTSTAGYIATALFMDILIKLSSAIIMPMIYVYIAAITAKAALGTSVLSGVVSFIKWACVTMMTLLVTAFTAYLSITGAIASSSDAAAAKLAKSAISMALPVVGGIVSGAAGTVVAGATMLRAGIGVFGMLVVLAVCVTPFLVLGIHYLIYKAVAALGSGIADSRMRDLISGIGTAFGMVLGLVGCGAIMLFFALVFAMKAVSVV